METNLIEWLETRYPNTLPTELVTEYTLGVLIGQRELIEQLKVKLKIEKATEEEVK